MKHKTRVIVAGSAIALLVLSGLACSISGEVNVDGPDVTVQARGGEADSEAATAVPTATAPAPTEPPEPTVPPEAPAEPTEPSAAPEVPEVPEGVGEALEMAEIEELEVTTLDPTGGGLGHLSSFRQRMTLDFTAEDSGYNSVLRYEGDVVPSDQAMYLTVRAEGAMAAELPSNQAEMIWIEDRVWIRVGNRPWRSVPEDVAEVRFEEQMFTVGDFLPFIQSFERVGEETINGISTAHYVYDVENAATEYGAFSGSGDVYVALDGGYVVRYTCNGHATFEEYLDGSSGTLNLVYDTVDVGAAIEINPPGD